MAQFLAVGLLLFVVIMVATTVLADRAARAEALADARSSTEVLATSVAEPALRPGLVRGEAGALDRFDREVVRRLLVGDVRRIKIWSEEGRIVYSDRSELIGSTYPLGEEELAILRHGGTEAEVSDLDRPENRFERDGGGLVEVYTRVHATDGEPLLFEAYYSSADIDQQRREVFFPFRRIAVGALLALVAVATPMIWVLTRRLTGAARDRERLLVAAIDASEAERRRIARDLHDGVVQDLAGTAYSVTAVARSRATPPESRRTLDGAADTLRAAMRSLRALLVELHPPDLRAHGLAAALADLTAPAASAGIAVRLEVRGAEAAQDATVALVWRVAQEAVRNAIRHAAATSLTVRVDGDEHVVTLDVVDDGVGFDPAAERDPARYGLRGLTSLVADAGGALQVDSAPGRGTRVHLEVTR